MVYYVSNYNPNFEFAECYLGKEKETREGDVN